MEERIYDYKKVNKITLLIYVIAVFLGALPNIFSGSGFGLEAIIVWIVGYGVISPAIIAYFINKHTILVKYFVGCGTVILMYTLLYQQKGVLDNLFWIYVALSVTCLFFDKWVAISTAFCTIILGIVFFIFLKDRCFPDISSDIFISYVLSIAFIGIILAFQGNFGKKLILDGMAKIKETNMLNSSLNKVFLNLKEISATVDDSITAINAKTQNSLNETKIINSTIQQYDFAINELAENASNSGVSLLTIEKYIEGIDRNSKKLSANSHDAYESAQDGKRIVSELVEQNNNINNLIKSTYDMVNSFNQSSQEIYQAAGFINGIASQINMLSLNATIEAARAGEAGKGFTVVADEIRKLSEQTSNTAKGISNVLNKITDQINNINIMMSNGIKAADSGISITNETYNRFINIIDKVNDVNIMASNITNDTHTLSSESIIIFDNIQNIAASTEETAAAMRNIAESIANQEGEIKNIEEQTSNLVVLSQKMKSITLSHQ